MMLPASAFAICVWALVMASVLAPIGFGAVRCLNSPSKAVSRCSEPPKRQQLALMALLPRFSTSESAWTAQATEVLARRRKSVRRTSTKGTVGWRIRRVRTAKSHLRSQSQSRVCCAGWCRGGARAAASRAATETCCWSRREAPRLPALLQQLASLLGRRAPRLRAPNFAAVLRLGADASEQPHCGEFCGG